MINQNGTNSELLSVLVKELASMLYISEDDVETEMPFEEISGFDSLVHLELVSLVEKTISRKLTVSEIMESDTLEKFGQLRK